MVKSAREAGALAIKNIGIIEQTYRLIDNQIVNELFPLIEGIVGDNLPIDWTKELPCFEAKMWCDKPAWFSIPNWKNSDEGYCAEFEVWAASPEGSDDLWDLTKLCGQGEAKVGFRWSGKHKILMPELKLHAWKKFASQQHIKYPHLAELGFQYEDASGSWFLPLLVEASELADAYANSEMEKVLEPAIKECLRRIEEASSIFSAIIASAKNS